MINPERSELLQLIADLSEEYPDWRLGQLLINVSNFADAEPWEAEDKQLLQAIKSHLAKKAKASAA